ncbi:MAG: primosomal protein N' [Ruminococcaceae bacterium]|nr:primosomal protein N' [Oscillospiraceae bacterium]
MYADIVITKKAHELDRLFCYKIPLELENKVVPGKRVIIPFGNYGKTEGIVFDVYSDREKIKGIKSIEEVIDATPVISETGFVIAKFLKEKYLCTYYDALKLNMPGGLKTFVDEQIFLLSDGEEDLSAEEEEIVSLLYKFNGCSYSALREKVKLKGLRALLLGMEEKGLIDIRSIHSEGLKDKTIRVVTLIVNNSECDEYIEKNKRATTRIKALEALKENKSMVLSDLRAYTKITKDGIEKLTEAGLIEVSENELLRDPFKNRDFDRNEKLPATLEQREAIDEILSGNFSTYLLHGITGSGKTEVYLQVIEEKLKEGKNAIVLVPEISLTPQMVSRFFSRFGDGVAVIHSGLSREERYDQYKLIKRGEIRVVIGARSAIFAPLENVGIIVIDEEHENSYKSDVFPKYDTLEIAKCRCSYEGATLVLASATPSVVSYYHAKKGDYKLIKLTKRTNNKKPPEAHIVDMRKELREGNFSPFSGLLKEALLKRGSMNEQSVLFINRRGYSTFVSCRSCGFVAKCPHCDVSLTYHSARNILSCHYCGYERENFTACPECKSSYIKHFGKGTQKVEEEIKKEFPHLSYIRMDADTTRAKFSHEKILEKFERENINILLGTQMITKGLDFKNVTLSCVLAADGGLHLEDYRATERTFSQITQVIGRAGRGDKEGIGIIQTYNPDHYVIKLAGKGDYEEFYESEINLRKQMNFPPFCDIINIICQSENKELCMKLIKECYNILVTAGRNLKLTDEELRIYRPNFAPLARIKNKYRMRILLKAKASEDISGILKKLYANYNENYKVKDIGLSVDINPVNML